MDRVNAVTAELNASHRTALPLGAEFERVNAAEFPAPSRVAAYPQSRQRDRIVEELHLVSRAQLPAEHDRPLPRPHAVAPRQIDRADEEQAEPDAVQFHCISDSEPEPPRSDRLRGRRST